jgi:hypothetical protein
LEPRGLGVGGRIATDVGLVFSTAPVAPVAPPVAPIQPEPRRDYGGGRFGDYGLEPAYGRDNMRAWGYDGR